MKHVLLWTIAFSTLILNGCGVQQKDQSPARMTTADTTKNATLDGAARIQQVRAALDEAKQKLADEGKYTCCVKPTCDFCALHEASCPCYDELTAGEHVCVECYSGWQQGRGADPKIKKESVTTSFVMHEHQH